MIHRGDGGIENIERDVGGKCWWGCIVASTTQIKHGFMRRPSLQDSQQLEKPHLLPWSGARATARPEYASSFLYHKRKRRRKKLKGREVGGGAGENGLEGCSKREAVCMGVWGRGAEEGNHRRITSEGLCVSVKLFSLSETVI